MRKVFSTLIFLLLMGVILSVFLSADSDREGRIIFATILNDFSDKASEMEKELLLTGRMTPNRQNTEESYLNSMDVKTKLSYDINIKSNSVTYQISTSAKFLANETIIFEPVMSKNSVKWLCNKGTVKKRYRPKVCRNNLGITIRK